METIMTSGRNRHQSWIIAIMAVLWMVGSAQAVLPSCYHRRADIDSFLVQLLRNDSAHHVVTVDTLGYSRGGMFGDTTFPLYCVRISAVPRTTYAPSILIVGQVHAEEVIGVELTLEFMKQLVERYGLYRNLLQSTQLYFIPTANPDGLEVVSRGWDDSYRKNGYHPPEMGWAETCAEWTSTGISR
jgi:hypothetical protein